MANLIPATIIAVIWCGSFLVAVTPFAIWGGHPAVTVKLATLVAIPILFFLMFPLLAGLISLTARKQIRRGKFPREPFHPVYLRRRIYGACWTQVYYFKPLYAVLLTIPFLKKCLFQVFGYKGNFQFTIYPDTWVRDLPLLEFGENAYLSNRATIGTNICLSDGSILVDRVRVGEKALIGHLTMLAPGCKIGDASEVGVGCAVGIRVNVNDGASIKPSCTINHGAVIGDGADIGTMSFVGLRAEIGPNVSLPAGSNIPAGAVIQTQQDVEKHFTSETVKLQKHKEEVGTVLHGYLRHGTL